MDRNPAPGMGTHCVWGGETDEMWERSTQVPVVHSVSYGYKDLEEWLAVARGERPGHIYSRTTNPTVAVFEKKVKVLEGAQAATAFSTGMAAVSGTLNTLLSAGDRVVSIKDTYGGTTKIFLEFLPKLSIEVTLCDTNDHDAIEAEIAKGCRLLYLESPTNPTLKVLDIERFTAAAHAVGALVVVDNTFATPINTNPLALGVDLVLHSATKFLGGHADALGGIVCGAEEVIEAIYHYREINGAALHPMSAYLLLRRDEDLKASYQTSKRERTRHSGISYRSSRGGRRVLPGSRHPSASCGGGASDEWIRRGAELYSEGGSRCGGRPASASRIWSCGGQPRGGGNRHWTTRYHQSCREYPGGKGGDGDTGRFAALLGWYRGY